MEAEEDLKKRPRNSGGQSDSLCSQAQSVEGIKDAGLFEQGMTEYVNRFMR